MFKMNHLVNFGRLQHMKGLIKNFAKGTGGLRAFFLSLSLLFFLSVSFFAYLMGISMDNSDADSAELNFPGDGIAETKIGTPLPEPVLPAASSTSSILSMPISAGESAPDSSASSSADFLNYNFGMSVGEAMMGLSDLELGRQLDDVASLGIGWLRFDIDWAHVQPDNRNDFDWRAIDRFVKAASKRGVKLLAIVGYTPKWARSPDCLSNGDRCAPGNAGEFAVFAAEAAARYSPRGVKTWEIWNEPNLKGSWEPAADIGDYAALLKASSLAIKKADSEAIVIAGGMGPAASKNGSISPIDFLSGLYRSEARDYFDAIGYHPYCYPDAPDDFQTWSGWSQMAQTKINLRSVMQDNGGSAKQIWLTEFGAPTGGPGGIKISAKDLARAGVDHVSENLQSQMISQAISYVKKNSWIGPLFIYSYRDLGTATGTNENFFGVLRHDGSKKPAYDAIKSEIR